MIGYLKLYRVVIKSKFDFKSYMPLIRFSKRLIPLNLPKCKQILLE